MRIRRLVILAAALAGGPACTRPAAEAGTTDTRQPLSLPAEAQDAVRAEMNGMLRSLNRILLSVPQGDTAAIRTAAHAAGLANAADPALEKLLPEQFLTWGTETHEGFDALAGSVGTSYDPDTVVAQLGRITQLCVTCHAVYRLGPP